MMNRSNSISPSALVLALGLAAIALFTSQPTLGQQSAPMVTITDDIIGTPDITNGAVTFTFTWNEAVTGFDATGITVTGGTAGTFTALDEDADAVPPIVADTVYTLIATPTTDINDGVLTVTVAANAATANGVNNAAASARQNYDTQAPAFASRAATTRALTGTLGGTTVYDANATDGDGDADAGITYTLNADDLGGGRTNDHLLFTITEETGLVSYKTSPSAAATHTIEIIATDDVGNTAMQIVIITVAPIVITSATVPDGNYGLDEIMPVIVTFSEDVTVSGLPVSGLPRIEIYTAPVNLSSFIGSAFYSAGTGSAKLTFEYRVRPNDNVSQIVLFNQSILLPSGATITRASDATVNAGLSIPGPVLTRQATIDTTTVPERPTVLITDNVNVDDGAPDITNLEEVTFTFEWNYAVTGFDLSDITVSGGTGDTGGTLTGSGTIYTLTAAIPTTPTNDGVLTVTVAANAVTANSGEGNVETTATQRYDTQEPTFAETDVTVPLSLDTSEGTVVYDANATDGGANDVGILTYGFFTGNEHGEFEDDPYVGQYNDFFNEFDISDEGIVTLYAMPTEDSAVTYVTQIIAYDAAGNTASQYVAFEFQDIPVVTSGVTVTITDNIDAPVAGIADGDVTFTFVWSETVTGFTTGDITVSSGTAGAFTSSGTTYTLTATPTTDTNDGVLTVTVAADAATTANNVGNAETSATQHYDTQAPGVPTIDDPIADDNAINAAELANNVVVSGIRGSHTDTVTLCFSLGTTAATEATCGGIGTAYTIDPGATTWGYTFSMTQIEKIIAGGQGIYTLTAIAEDAAGNSAAVGKALTVDTIAPAFISGYSANANVGADSSVVVYDADAVDGGGAADYGLTYTLTGTDSATFSLDTARGILTPAATLATAATYSVDITATDEAGNAATQYLTIVVADIPTVTITDSEPAEYANSAVTFTFTWSEMVTDFAADDITVFGVFGSTTYTPTKDFTGSGTTYTLTATPAAGTTATNDGFLIVTVAADAATATATANSMGNTETTATQKYDNVVPVFTSGNTATATVGADPSVVVYNAEATDAVGTLVAPADTRITYSLSGGAHAMTFNIDENNGEVTYKASPSAAATHTFEITATDKGDNTVTQTVTITVNEIPVVTITDNVAGEYANGEVTFKFEWNVVVTGFESDDITVDGGTKGTFATANSTIYTLTATPTTDTNDGVLTVTVSADALATGGANTETRAEKKYDNVAPVFTSGNPPTTTSVSMGTTIYTADVTTATVGMATTAVVYDAEATDGSGTADDGITYRLTGGANVGLFDTAGTAGFVTYKTSPPAVATHTIEITATDKGGNTATQTVTITVNERLAGVANDPTDLALLGPTGTSLMGTTVTLDEGSNTYTYTVALTYQPTSDVDVRIDSDNPDVTLDWSLLRFTMDNWQTPQSITITAAEDADADNDSATLTHTASGGGYDGVIANVDVTVTDNFNFTAGLNLSETDDMGMTVTLTTPVTLVEGNTHTYTVALSYEPTADVDVRIDSNNADVTPSRSSLRFTMDNWETPQSVTITAAEDADTRNDSATLTHTASGGGYDGVIANVAVTVTEAGLTLSETTVTFNEGGTYTYTVALVATPSAAVTVNIESNNGVTPSPSSLTFTTTDTQTVTITADEDDTDGIDSLATLTHTASGAGYDALSEVELPVTIIDNDDAPTVTITDDFAGTYTNDDVTFTFTWSMSVTGFEAEDITVIGGAPGTFTGTDPGMVYTLVVTPDAGTNDGVLRVTVKPRVARASGIDNAGASTVAHKYDTAAPAFTSGNTATATATVGMATTAVVYDADAVDGDDAADVGITYSLGGGAHAMTFNIDKNTGEVTYKVSPSVAEAHTFEITATDKGGNTVTQTVTVTVTVMGHDTARLNEQTTARLNEQILTRATQAITTGTTAALSARVEAAVDGAGFGAGAGDSPTLAYQFGGQSSLRGLLQTHGKAMLEDEMDYAQLLDGASFVMPLSAGGAGGGKLGGLSLWGGADFSNLEGDADNLDWDGEVVSFHLGVDTPVGNNMLAGLALSLNTASFDYTDAGQNGQSGDYEYSTTNLNPYFGYIHNEKLNFWGAAGFGQGEIETNADGAAKNTTDTSHLSLAGGFSNQIFRAPGRLPDSVTTLSVKSDASVVQVEVDGDQNAGFAAQEIDSRHLRLLVSSEQRRQLAGGGSLVPSMEVGVRYDGGDGVTGSGVEVGTGVRYANPGGKLTLAGNVRSLHLDAYDAWGADFTVRLAPQSGRGLSLSLQPVWGQTQSTAERLWDEGAVELVGDTALRSRMNSEVGYGLATTMLGSTGVLTPYAGMTTADGGVSQVRLGGRFVGGAGLSLKLEGARENGGDDASHTVLLRGELAF